MLFLSSSAFGESPIAPTITAHYDGAISAGDDLVIDVSVQGALPGPSTSTAPTSSAVSSPSTSSSSSSSGTTSSGSTDSNSSGTSTATAAPTSTTTPTTTRTSTSTTSCTPTTSTVTYTTSFDNTITYTNSSTATSTSTYTTTFPTIINVTQPPIVVTAPRTDITTYLTTTTETTTVPTLSVGSSTSTSACPLPPELRQAGGALLAASNPTPASGTVSVWVQGTEIGHGTLDAAGEATIRADTSSLQSGEYELSFRYSGDANFAAAELTSPLSVQAAQTSVSTPAGPSTTVVTTSGPELASTGTDSRVSLGIALALLLAGVGLLLAGRVRHSGAHH